jgi:hypothetical protein
VRERGEDAAQDEDDGQRAVGQRDAVVQDVLDGREAEPDHGRVDDAVERPADLVPEAPVEQHQHGGLARLLHDGGDQRRRQHRRGVLADGSDQDGLGGAVHDDREQHDGGGARGEGPDQRGAGLRVQPVEQQRRPGVERQQQQGGDGRGHEGRRPDLDDQEQQRQRARDAEDHHAARADDAGRHAHPLAQRGRDEHLGGGRPRRPVPEAQLPLVPRVGVVAGRDGGLPGHLHVGRAGRPTRG